MYNFKYIRPDDIDNVFYLYIYTEGVSEIGGQILRAIVLTIMMKKSHMNMGLKTLPFRVINFFFFFFLITILIFRRNTSSLQLDFSSYKQYYLLLIECTYNSKQNF